MSQARKVCAAMVAVSAFHIGPAFSQAPPRADGETLRLQYIGGSVVNFAAIVAEKKGFCERYNFRCETKAINAGPLAIQSLIGNSVDVALTGTDSAVATAAEGGGLVIVATLRQGNPFSVAVRSDVPMPHKAMGYPAVMQDFKGKKIGVTGRGAAVENNFVALMNSAGLQSSDVTFVAVGGPGTAFQALTVGKQVDALAMFEPIPVLCDFSRACDVVVDLTKGDGPPIITAMNGAMIALLMRRDMVEKNPNLARAYVAATKDATKWAQDPANFEELVKIYEPIVSFGEQPKAAEMRRELIKREITSAISPGLETSRPALKAIVDFALANKTITKPVDPASLVWAEAP